MIRGDQMSEFVQEDSDWFDKVYEMPMLFKIVITDNDIYVETIGDDNNKPKWQYTFSLCGYEFAHALLKDMGINCDMY